MTHAIKRRRREPSAARSGANIGGLLLVLVGLLGGFYYLLPAITSDDWLWFSTAFDEQARTITIIDRGERTTLDPADPRFAALNDAFNRTMSAGYRAGSLGFSDPTWALVNEHGLLVEMAYAAPVRIHLRGGYTPKERLLLLVAGDHPGIHTTQTLFSSDDGNYTTGIPIIVDDVTPLATALERNGFAVP